MRIISIWIAGGKKNITGAGDEQGKMCIRDMAMRDQVANVSLGGPTTAPQAGHPRFGCAVSSRSKMEWTALSMDWTRSTTAR